MTERDPAEEALHLLGLDIADARSALWSGETGKAFAAIEAAEEEYERLQDALEEAETDD